MSAMPLQPATGGNVRALPVPEPEAYLTRRHRPRRTAQTAHDGTGA